MFYLILFPIWERKAVKFSHCKDDSTIFLYNPTNTHILSRKVLIYPFSYSNATGIKIASESFFCLWGNFKAQYMICYLLYKTLAIIKYLQKLRYLGKSLDLSSGVFGDAIQVHGHKTPFRTLLLHNQYPYPISEDTDIYVHI